MIETLRPARPAQRWTTAVNGHRLRDLRRQRGLSRRQLAAQTGISAGTIARLERQAEAACRCRTLARLSAALGQTPAAFAIDPAVRRRIVPA
jgi:transcriptional regulator with XRE-family HTH domain